MGEECRFLSMEDLGSERHHRKGKSFEIGIAKARRGVFCFILGLARFYYFVIGQIDLTTCLKFIRMKKLIKGCKELERRSQREMVDHLSPFLYNICRRYTHNQEDAKDLLQESLIQIFNNMDKCQARDKATFFAWSKRIAINRALAQKRKKGLEVESMVENTHHLPIVPSIQSQLNVQDILKLLHLLPQNQSLVFNLSVIDGYSHAEIAKILEVKESSSRTFLTRARQSLQQLIQKQEIDL